MAKRTREKLVVSSHLVPNTVQLRLKLFPKVLFFDNRIRVASRRERRIRVASRREGHKEKKEMLNLSVLPLFPDPHTVRLGLFGGLQERKCPIVVASEAKQSQPLGLLRFARNDGFWIIYFLEHS
ncbi:hypothetical protein CDG79_01885 [Nostoc sp. 'Peltigera membranacea cyanobiont' 232]|nr:hypothetical protein CDG79_01885 [Nostoc sp. 'Peltigera membranacea cyanobiont' 232]